MQGCPFEHFLPLFICTGSIKRGDCGGVGFFNRGSEGSNPHSPRLSNDWETEVVKRFINLIQEKWRIGCCGKCLSFK